jgi:4-amino-4-deoxy-L-arabinose transferase-like glycosyltransferase
MSLRERWAPTSARGVPVAEQRARLEAEPDEARWSRVARRSVLLGAAIRVIYGIVLHPPLYHIIGDAGGYVDRASRLAGKADLPRLDFFMPSGTQMLISLPMRVFGSGHSGLWAASVLWCALSCCYPWLAWKWAGQLLSPRAAAITAIGCAFSPLAIIYGGYFGSELPAMVLLPAALWLLQACGQQPERRRLALLAGAVTVALVLVRQQFVLNVALASAPLVACFRRRVGRLALGGVLAGGAAVLVAVVVLVTPAGRVQGGLAPLAGQNGGLNFFYGRCDARLLRTADLSFENPVRAQRRTGNDIRLPARHAADQGFFYGQGLACLRRAPVRAGVIALRSVADMTTTSIPFPPWTETGLLLLVAEAGNAVFCLLLVALVGAALRVVRHQRVAAILLAHLACAFVIAMIFVGEPRYRLPYDLFGWALLGWWVARREPLRAPA